MLEQEPSLAAFIKEIKPDTVAAPLGMAYAESQGPAANPSDHDTLSVILYQLGLQTLPVLWLELQAGNGWVVFHDV